MKLNEVGDEFENIEPTSSSEKIRIIRQKLNSLMHQIDIYIQRLNKFDSFIRGYQYDNKMHSNDYKNGFLLFKTPGIDKFSVYGPGMDPKQVQRLTIVIQRLDNLMKLAQHVRKKLEWLRKERLRRERGGAKNP